MPTPSEAAAILRAHFGMVQDPADPSVMVGDPTGAVALGANRRLQNELDDRIVNDKFAAALGPQVGYEPGAPGRRYASNLPAANLIADEEQSHQLERDQANDPFTGTAEQARVGGIQKALDAAALTERPEIDEQAKTIATRNAFADYMKSKGMKMGEYEAASSPAAQAAAMIPINAASTDVAQGNKNRDLEREQQLRMSPQLVPGQMPDASGAGGGTGGFTLPPNYKPLNTQESTAIESMAKAAPMVGDLKRMLDPTLDQIPNKVAQTGKWALYKMGLSPDLFMNQSDPKEQARLQLASLIKIVGSSPYMTGSRNYRYLQDVQQHLTNPMATDKFLYNQISELQQRWPEIQKAVIQTHIQPGTALNFGDGGDPWAAPPTPAELRR